jgi:hypothetical protein
VIWVLEGGRVEDGAYRSVSLLRGKSDPAREEMMRVRVGGFRRQPGHFLLEFFGSSTASQQAVTAFLRKLCLKHLGLAANFGWPEAQLPSALFLLFLPLLFLPSVTIDLDRPLRQVRLASLNQDSNRGRCSKQG